MNTRNYMVCSNWTVPFVPEKTEILIASFVDDSKMIDFRFLQIVNFRGLWLRFEVREVLCLLSIDAQVNLGIDSVCGTNMGFLADFFPVDNGLVDMIRVKIPLCSGLLQMLAEFPGIFLNIFFEIFDEVDVLFVVVLIIVRNLHFCDGFSTILNLYFELDAIIAGIGGMV